jgi:hypothetical protein
LTIGRRRNIAFSNWGRKKERMTSTARRRAAEVKAGLLSAKATGLA